MGEKRHACRILVGKPVKRYRKDLGVGGRIIFNWILRKYDGAVWTRLIWLRTGTSGGLL
jgi:hypothetical protein